MNQPVIKQPATCSTLLCPTPDHGLTYIITVITTAVEQEFFGFKEALNKKNENLRSRKKTRRKQGLPLPTYL